MTGDSADEGGRSPVGRSEIDELLHDLVYRHESDDQSPLFDWRRRLPVVAVLGLLGLLIAGFVSAGFLASGFLLAQDEQSPDSRPARSSTSTDGADGHDGRAGDGGLAGHEGQAEGVAGPDVLNEDEEGTDPSEGSPETGPPPTAISQLRVGIVLPGDASDRAFSQSMVDGAAVLLDTGGISDMAIVENVSSAEAGQEIRNFADEGYDLVVAHSSVYETTVFSVAAGYPEVTFAVAGTTNPVPLDNVYTYTAAAEEGGYVLGALSAMLSPSGVVGVVGPSEVGVSKRYVDGFRQGASDERADLVIHVAYTGSFTDADAFAAATARHLEQGADVITGHGSNLDVAVSTAADRQAEWLGSQVDQSPVAPRSVVASQVYHWDVVLGQIVTDVEADDVDGRHMRADLANGGILIAFNDSRALEPKVRDRVDRLAAEISAGLLRPLEER